MGPWGTLGMQAAGQASGGIMGLALGGIERKNQLKQQQNMQQLEMQGQRQMTNYNMQKQLELWEKTNYSAQIDQMKKAGLNPALIYGMSGGGGQTTDVAAGRVTGGQAQQGNYGIAGMELGSRMATTAAQLELIKAQTEKTKAEAEAVGPTVEKTKAETSLVLQNIKNAKAQEEYTNIMAGFKQLETQFASESYRSRMSMIDRQVEQAIATIKKIGLENKFTEQTWNDAAKEISQKAIQAELQNELLKVQKTAAEKGMELTNQQIWKMSEEIAMGWKGLTLQEISGIREDIKISQQDLQLLYNGMKTKFDVSHPGLWNVIGGSLEETIKQTVEDIKTKLKRLKPKL